MGREGGGHGGEKASRGPQASAHATGSTSPIRSWCLPEGGGPLLGCGSTGLASDREGLRSREPPQKNLGPGPLGFLTYYFWGRSLRAQV